MKKKWQPPKQMTKLSDERKAQLDEFIKQYPEIKRWVYNQERCNDQIISITLRFTDDGVSSALLNTNYTEKFHEYIKERSMFILDEPWIFLN